jgi:hypothetical protein
VASALVHGMVSIGGLVSAGLWQRPQHYAAYPGEMTVIRTRPCEPYSEIAALTAAANQVTTWRCTGAASSIAAMP